MEYNFRKYTGARLINYIFMILKRFGILKLPQMKDAQKMEILSTNNFIISIATTRIPHGYFCITERGSDMDIKSPIFFYFPWR